MNTQSHDEYKLGEFKDDCLQDHEHKQVFYSTASGGNYENRWYRGNNEIRGTFTSGQVDDTSARISDVTHGKQIGIKYIIKVL